jgi:hypothetical protein
VDGEEYSRILPIGLLKCALVTADSAGFRKRTRMQMSKRTWIRIGQLLLTVIVTLPTGETAIRSPHPPHPILLFLSYFCSIELSYLTSSASQQLNRNHATTATAHPFFVRLLKVIRLEPIHPCFNLYFQRRCHSFTTMQRNHVAVYRDFINFKICPLSFRGVSSALVSGVPSL